MASPHTLQAKCWQLPNTELPASYSHMKHKAPGSYGMAQCPSPRAKISVSPPPHILIGLATTSISTIAYDELSPLHGLMPAFSSPQIQYE